MRMSLHGVRLRATRRLLYFDLSSFYTQMDLVYGGFLLETL